MIKEELFQLIRSEKVMLWSGAGLSLYAGYPSGKKLGDIIIKSLSSTQKPLISSKQSLDNICEQFVQINGNERKSLYEILERIFSKKPKSTELHKKLSLIPHFKSIVTTNYDPLFELAYRNNIQVIASLAELRDLQNKKPNLFKIHGDLSHKENIIITKSDYANYFDASRDSVYWATIIERIVNNNVLFIGYAFGDINIEAIIRSISRQLGDKQRKHFLVAPNFKEHEIESLRLKNIHYINSTAEEFIDELIGVLRETVVKDYGTGMIGLDTLNAFLKCHDLSADFIAAQSNHLISRIAPIGGRSRPGILSISGSPTITNAIVDIGVGKNFGPLRLNPSELEIQASMAGIKIFDEGDLESLVFIPRPTIQTTFDVDFTNGFDLRDIPVKLYSSRYKSSTVIEYKKKIVRIDTEGLNAEDFHLSLEYPRPYGNPKDELEAFKSLLYLVQGVPFTVFIEGKGHQGRIPANNEMAEVLEKYVSYFQALLDIEKTYQVRFGVIDEITESQYNVICVLLHIIEAETILFEAKDCLEITMSEIEFIEFEKLYGKTANEISLVYTDFAVTLYGQTFRFKERIWRLFNPELVSFDKAADGSIKAKFRSRTAEASDTYILEDRPWIHSFTNSPA